MPANLTPEYRDAEKRYREAGSVEEKIVCLEEMLRVIPKHKGTDKLQGDIKARLAKLRRAPRKKGAARVHSHMVQKEGAGQVALVGPPNSGKSSLVAALTHARPEVAEYPFTTREATPGMMPFEDIAFQLVDLPPLSEEYVEAWVYDQLRRADLAWLVLSVENPLSGLEKVLPLLEAKRIRLHPVEEGETEARDLSWTEKPTILVVTGSDRPEAEETIEILDELIEVDWRELLVSTVSGSGLEDLKRRTFEALEIIRVYTKQPGKPADMDQPFALHQGETVADLARHIHKDLHDQLRFARIWGSGVFEGQTVQRDHVLTDGDVIEIHT
jgi:ribosome-interacting GTPase 1